MRNVVILGAAGALIAMGVPDRARSQQVDSATASDSAQRLRAVSVVGIPAIARRFPGSWQVLDAARLERDRVFTTNEALRKVSGVHVRDEEGIGLRPNIGIRGLNPTRSTKVLLLEDGVPVMIAPYGDNASYYHPPVERMDRIEVLKGAGQLQYGPQAVGGVINYVTPLIPDTPGGSVTLRVGGRRFVSGHVRTGGTWDGAGLLVDVLRKESAGSRDNIFSQVEDASLKANLALGAAQSVLLKANQYRERSQVTYSGLTEAEWAADPRQNPFVNDRFDVLRYGGTVTHRARAGRWSLATTAYGHLVNRDWWRQSSNSTQRPNDRSDPACGGLANLNTTCGNEGRLRAYRVGGIEPRASASWHAGGTAVTVDLGVRAHRELQERRQVNGAFPDSRTEGPSGNPNSGIVEDNQRTTNALSAFVRLAVGGDRWSVAPGLRVERLAIGRTNRRPVPNHPRGVSGDTALVVAVPGVGVSVAASPRLDLFAGVHRGYAPPRPEDIISNTTGGSVELDPESSVNVEVGARWRPRNGVRVDVTAFRMDFANQIVPASIAGGTGAALTNAGQTRHQGVELDVGVVAPARRGWSPHFDVAVTAVPTARFEGPRFAFLGTGGSDVVGRVYAEQNAAGTRTRVSVTGNRLPYSPALLATVGLGVAHRREVSLGVEAVHVGEQFGDAVNTRVTVPDGQQGTLPANTIWNATAAWTMAQSGVTVFGTVKNLTDAVVLVDRTRGLIPAMPRLVQTGVRYDF